MNKRRRLSMPFIGLFAGILLLIICVEVFHVFIPKLEQAWKRQDIDAALLDAAMRQHDRTTFDSATAYMKSALEQGANVNAQSSKGVTALIYCAAYDNAEGVKMLLAHHADVTIKTWGGDTAMGRGHSTGSSENK